jgi:hypothetical protein
MSLAQVKTEAASLSPKEQGELMSFLAAIQLAGDKDLRQGLTQKIDDQNSDHWIDLDVLKERWKD